MHKVIFIYLFSHVGAVTTSALKLRRNSTTLHARTGSQCPSLAGAYGQLFTIPTVRTTMHPFYGHIAQLSYDFLNIL